MRDFKELLGRNAVRICGFSIIALTIAIALFLTVRGSESFTVYGHSLNEFLFSSEWRPEDNFTGGGKIGSAVYIVGSLLTCALALLLAVPPSLAVAIFMAELQPEVGNRYIKPAVELFVGIPSVVYGWVGLTVLVPAIAKLFDRPHGLSVLAAGLVLGLMIFPTITTLMNDALKAVPKSYRSAAYALGSTRWQVIWRVVIPAARSGLYTALIMGLARAFGEALAVAMVIGKSRIFPDSILAPTINLTAAIATDMGGATEGGEYNMALWSMALLLFIVALICIAVVHLFQMLEKRRHEK